jgi:dTDP-4-amino-4,6-dideoxygalactose transaminase
MIPRLKPALGAAELRATLRPPRRDAVERFEAAFAAAMGTRYGVAFSYGRTAQWALLKALGLEGAEVVMPAYTCVVVAHATVLSGNVPRFVDAAEGEYNMDLDALAEAITERTRVVVATHLFGYPMDVDRVREIVADAERRHGHKIWVVQDCAHAFRARWRGRLVAGAGDVGLFGLNISKMITSIFGGMLTTDDAALADRLRTFRDRAMSAPDAAHAARRRAYLWAVYPAFSRAGYDAVHWIETHTPALDTLTKAYHLDDEVRFPPDAMRRMSRVEAAVGVAQLDRLPSIEAARAEHARYYDAALAGMPGLSLPPIVDGATYSHYVVRVDDRARYLREAESRGVQLGQLIEYSVPELRAYAPYARGESFPRSGAYNRTTINLPVHAALSPAERESVVAAVRAATRAPGPVPALV